MKRAKRIQFTLAELEEMLAEMAYVDAGWNGYADNYFCDVDDDAAVEFHPRTKAAISAMRKLHLLIDRKRHGGQP